MCSVLLGFIFDRLKLDIPCPPTIEGIIGIAGLFVGFKLSEFL